ncbi:TQXA domain-containing protein [Mycobacterium florentinum]|uniref:TQXA domain-containing protein n=1 Tax=Mycobacterium florentinum TaxID=292462 RepID=A0A1X1UBP9_MYCFL|nr:thioester domain-containing protein [Mycobacterium florentinum]MCV7412223.1 TQXA domain-containing protein [Mycobacterium florentinum]ORV54231.1 TQXA domain-containing protein [Mycobacterium florentinum]BBX81601.1 TQXA domain-containing protein [Mycobacterium florentinum]
MTVLSISSRALAEVTTRPRIMARPAKDLPQMTRYRGGTYSHTVDTITFSDGSTARTDLIRLHPSLHAYSLNFSGIAPHLPSRYRLGTWSALEHLRSRDYEAEVDWILRHSYPLRTTAELSRRLRAAGYPLGTGNLEEHEAIAATQAAIWYLTNGLSLDTQPLNVPIAVHRGPGPEITFEFDGQPQLGGYSVWTASDSTVNLRLQKSANSVDWQEISGSQLTTSAAMGRYERALGIGSTLSSSSHGHRGHGYRYYRLIAETVDGTAPKIGHVGFWLTGTRHYRNADRVVHLYNYLLSGALKAPQRPDESTLIDTEATAGPELVGPFHVRIPLTFNVADGHSLVDADGFAVDGTVHPGTDFYLRPAPGTSTATLTATTSYRLPGRVLTGVAPEAPEQFTPVALAVPSDVAIHFDIRWNGVCDNR